MQRFDQTTGFLIADPDSNYFTAMPDYNSVIKAVNSMILSASGWRKVFAIDCNEESQTEEISSKDYFIAGAMALSFSAFIKKRIKERQPLILLGMDARFTGPAIADAMTRVFISEGLDVRSLFIVAAPEIMACSAASSDIDGFAYISASHNPVGHNGLKFGANGGVYGGDESKELISTFRELLEDKDIIVKIDNLLTNFDKIKYISVINAIPGWKKKAFETYLTFSRAVIADSTSSADIDEMCDSLRKAAAVREVGIVAELNGSARTLSIDRIILESYGITVRSINDKPREIVHRIVPEGFSLDTCREELEKSYIKDNRFILGYVPDNDGDRGNLVYIDTNTEKAEILEAQEVFALAVLSELAFMTLNRNSSDNPLAVAVNGPTSMRIDAIADVFGVKVFRAEVGEANVVNLAQDLRDQGYIVRILGEGSNGGNITHPAAVRDPINTVFSIIKLMLFKDLFRIWSEKSGHLDNYNDSYGIKDILTTLPSFTTTSAYDDRAIMRITTNDHILLKQRYEDIFLTEWDKQKIYLEENFGIYSWREINYEIKDEKTGFGPTFRSGLQKGGLKIIFSDKEGRDTDYIWMRGSGTEPVFRILADCTGNDSKRETWLLDWHRFMIEKADKWPKKEARKRAEKGDRE